MKTILRLRRFTQICLGLWTLAIGLGPASATPFYFQGYTSTGAANTNQIGVAYFPPSQSPFTIYGTNIIYGGNILTITPNSSGYSSNWLYPGTYQFYMTNLNSSFIAAIPDTVSFQSLALYVTNAPVFPGVGLNSYGMVTNLLGLAPTTNNPTGIIFALGYTPATNTYNGITNSLGFAPPTNNYSGLTNALGLAPATNSNTGIVFALGFTPATNNYNGITNSLGFAPATNSTAGIKAALGYTPSTNYVGQSGAVAFLNTNGFTIWVSYQTNAVPGTAFTNLPQGSILTTTNGAFFVLSNLVWTPK